MEWLAKSRCSSFPLLTRRLGSRAKTPPQPQIRRRLSVKRALSNKKSWSSRCDHSWHSGQNIIQTRTRSLFPSLPTPTLILITSVVLERHHTIGVCVAPSRNNSPWYLGDITRQGFGRSFPPQTTLVLIPLSGLSCGTVLFHALLILFPAHQPPIPTLPLVLLASLINTAPQ